MRTIDTQDERGAPSTSQSTANRQSISPAVLDISDSRNTSLEIFNRKGSRRGYLSRAKERSKTQRVAHPACTNATVHVLLTY